uniref:Uncharacterized protein n=1 Tax=Spongospora subterranea TaxID=70186 RepID=A0A0H5QQD9_9EUKA|eukprot:CRZ03691.1 hypothetical protein [Spongospora subterranea]
MYIYAHQHRQISDVIPLANSYSLFFVVWHVEELNHKCTHLSQWRMDLIISQKRVNSRAVCINCKMMRAGLLHWMFRKRTIPNVLNVEDKKANGSIQITRSTS